MTNRNVVSGRERYAGAACDFSRSEEGGLRHGGGMISRAAGTGSGTSRAAGALYDTNGNGRVAIDIYGAESGRKPIAREWRPTARKRQKRMNKNLYGHFCCLMPAGAQVT